MTNSDTESDAVNEDLVRQTAKIAWSELQRFFAQGVAIRVADELDLVQIAGRVAADDRSEIEQLLQEGQLAVVADEVAKDWLERDLLVWAVVVAPWVLVQLPREAVKS